MNDETKIYDVIKVDDSNNKDLTNHIQNVKKDLPKYWDKTHINDKINLIKNYQHKMLMIFLWHTGIRITEAVSIRKQDIDFQNYTIKLRWLKSRKYNYRFIPIHPNLKNMLEIYVATLKGDDIVFHISRQRAWQLTRKYFQGHPHQLRHSFAVNWLRCGGDIVSLHKILGHSKIQTTMEYLRIVPSDLGKELMKISF